MDSVRPAKFFVLILTFKCFCVSFKLFFCSYVVILFLSLFAFKLKLYFNAVSNFSFLDNELVVHSSIIL